MVATTRWRRLPISVVLPETVMARSHHGHLLALGHYPLPPKPPKPPTTHARKVPPTPLFVESSEPHDVWDRRNLLLPTCGYVPLPLGPEGAALAPRAFAAKLAKCGLRGVPFPLRPSGVFGVYPRPRPRGLWIQANCGILGEPSKECVVPQPPSEISGSQRVCFAHR